MAADDLVERVARAGEQIIAAPAPDVAEELNRQLNRLWGWPFQAAKGIAFDLSLP
jgi:hypothetical protein